MESTAQTPTSSFPSNKTDTEIDTVMPPEEIVERNRPEKGANCCKWSLAFLFSVLGLSAYVLLGGYIFMTLEGSNEQKVKNNVEMTRKQHVERIWNMTNEMNVMYPENWTSMAMQVMESFQREVFIAAREDGWNGKDGEADAQWTFAGATLYSISVITTIGYGNVTPKTNVGRLVTILYALIGIPLTLLTLSILGSTMATAFRFLYKNVCCGICCLCCRNPDGSKQSRLEYDAENGDPGASKRLASVSPDHSPNNDPITDSTIVRVPVSVSLVLILSYMLAGAFLLSVWEHDWDFLIGLYFCFVTLTTIGFGDFVPGTAYESRASQEKLIVCSLYLIVGLALVAMCFDLMQAEVRDKCRWLGKKIGLVSSTGKDQGPISLKAIS